MEIEVKIKFWVVPIPWGDEEFQITPYLHGDSVIEGSYLLCERTVILDDLPEVTQESFANGQIASLEAEKDKVMATAMDLCGGLSEQIEKLRALPAPETKDGEVV